MDGGRQKIFDIDIPVEAECKGHDVVLVVVGTLVIVDILGRKSLPLGPAAALHTGRHTLPVQRLRLAEVH